MNIQIIFQNVLGNELLTSIENKDIVYFTGQTSFISFFSINPLWFIVKNVTCTLSVFNLIVPMANTKEAPILIENALSTRIENRINVYIGNGSLKIA